MQIAMRLLENKPSAKPSLKISRPLLSLILGKKRWILNIYMSIDPQKPTTILVKKILRKIQTSRGSCNIPRMLETLKKLGKTRKIRNIKEEIVKVVSLIIQGMQRLIQRLESISLSFYQRVTEIGPEIRIKIKTNLLIIIVINRGTLLNCVQNLIS